MQKPFNYRDPIHLSVLVLGSFCFIGVFFFFFALIFSPPSAANAHSNSSHSSSSFFPETSHPKALFGGKGHGWGIAYHSSDDGDGGKYPPLFDQQSYYSSFKNQLFYNAKNNICNPANSTVAQLTRDKQVVAVHSHNDYWRPLPVFDALSYGFNSIEADIWLKEVPRNNNHKGNKDEKNEKNRSKSDKVLLVGHNELFLSPESTVEKLYLNVIARLLDEVNCDPHPIDNNDKEKNKRQEKSNTGKHGLFYNSPEQTTYLYIDIKPDDAVQTYKLFISTILQKTNLVKSNYLTYYNFQLGKVIWGPLTLVVTGNVPLQFIQNEQFADPFNINKRVVFVDAPLANLQQQQQDQPGGSSYNDSISVVASGSLRHLVNKDPVKDAGVEFTSFDGLTEDQLANVKERVKVAHDMNLKTRIWDAPNWPKLIRNKVWKQLWSNVAVDFLNVDDLNDVREF